MHGLSDPTVRRPAGVGGGAAGVIYVLDGADTVVRGWCPTCTASMMYAGDVPPRVIGVGTRLSRRVPLRDRCAASPRSLADAAKADLGRSNEASHLSDFRSRAWLEAGSRSRCRRPAALGEVVLDLERHGPRGRDPRCSRCRHGRDPSGHGDHVRVLLTEWHAGRSDVGLLSSGRRDGSIRLCDPPRRIPDARAIRRDQPADLREKRGVPRAGQVDEIEADRARPFVPGGNPITASPTPIAPEPPSEASRTAARRRRRVRTRSSISQPTRPCPVSSSAPTSGDGVLSARRDRPSGRGPSGARGRRRPMGGTSIARAALDSTSGRASTTRRPPAVWRRSREAK